jgi:1-pyrroline-4-hydroxy-2-carboxylate deaminase
MSIEWKGIFPAVTTPFTPDDQLDLPLFEKNLLTQKEAGVNAVIIGGSLGEASTLTAEDKKTLVKAAVKKGMGKIPVLLNIAEGSTREALKQVVDAKSWGVDGFMLLPPMRYKADDNETLNFFKTIAESTDLPVMIYNNPIDYKIEVTLEMFEELAGFKNIQAVKDSTRDVTNVIRMRNRFGDRFAILCGVDTLAMETLLMGADGWVAGLVNAFPKETVSIYNLISEGRIEEAANIYRWFMPLLELDLHPKLVQYIKLAQAQTGLGSEYVRPPRLMLTGKERERILKVINSSLAGRPEINF